MKRLKSLLTVTLLLAAAFLSTSLMAQGTTAFTYQGRLTDNNAPANGEYDLRFTLFSDSIAGNQAGTPVVVAPVAATNGIFTVALDFGQSVFIGADRWLQIEVRTNGFSGAYDLLAPRQQITPTPYALFAAGVNASSIIGQVTGNQLNATIPNQMSFTAAGNQFTGAFTGDGSGLTGLNGAAISGVDASKITSGTLGSARIPNLDASKTTSGVFSLLRIPTLDDSKLSPIVTAGKVSNSATTGTASNTGNTLVLRNANGDFNANTVQLEKSLTLPNTDSTGSEGAIFMGGALLIHALGNENFYAGRRAGQALPNVIHTTAVGADALFSNTNGSFNTAMGRSVLRFNTSGDNNTGIGSSALYSNTTGSGNSAMGSATLYANTTGNNNTALGEASLRVNTTGRNNTAVGRTALYNNVTGDNNIAVGFDAGALTTGSDTIMIGNAGNAGESGVVRIGTAGKHTDTYLTGVIHGDGSGLTSLNGTNFTTGSVGASALANNSVTSSEIANGAVIAGKLGNNAVATANITAGAVTAAKIDSSIGLWQRAGVDLYHTGGSVGIGVTGISIRPLVVRADTDLDVFGIQTPAGANKWHLALRANGSLDFVESDIQNNRFFLESGGNVGIGTDTPQARLHVNGDAVTTGKLGVGTTSPTKAKLEISGNATGNLTAGYRMLSSSAGATYSAGNQLLSLYADGQLAAAAIYAFSDERIKRVEGRSDSAHDLNTILEIEVTDYTYVDTLVKGAGSQKKVIAQQVEKIFPQAVSKSTDVVPDIFKMGTLKNGWIQLATNLKKGERVRLIADKSQGVYEVVEVAGDKFRTDLVSDDAEVFVYGREVKDFRSVDYEAISMLNVSATQELHRQVQEQAGEITSLRERLHQLEQERTGLKQAAAKADGNLADRVAQLEKLLSTQAAKLGGDQ